MYENGKREINKKCLGKIWQKTEIESSVNDIIREITNKGKQKERKKKRYISPKKDKKV